MFGIGGWLYFWASSLPDGPYLAAELGAAGAGCTDLTPDWIAEEPPEESHGIAAAGPMDLVASSGVFSFALNNSAANSGSTLGYYSPEHASCRTGWVLGKKVRWWWSVGGVSYPLFVGWLDRVEPEPGAYLNRRVHCAALDWMNEAAGTRLNVATQVSKRTDQVVQTIGTAVVKQPESYSLDTGSSTFAYALDTARAEASNALAELQRAVASERGLLGVTGAGVLRMLSRASVILATPDAAFTDSSMEALGVPQFRGAIYNLVRVVAHPRRVDAAATSVLATAQGTPTIAVGETVIYTAVYTDPAARAIRVGGTDMVAPVATTDYTFNAAADGSGSDLTASFAVVATYGANTVEWSVTNNSGSLGYRTKLQSRGRGLYDYDPIEVVSSDATSIAAYGKREIAIDLPYESDQNVAQAIADLIVATWKDPTAAGATIGFDCVTSTLLTLGLTLDFGSVIALTETVSGVDATYRIVGVRRSIVRTRWLFVEWTLSRVRAEDYWLLGTAGKSELGETTILGPG